MPADVTLALILGYVQTMRQGQFICTAPFNNKTIQSALDET